MAGEPKSHMATINTLQELLVDELRDLYDAENQLVKALPKMAKAATNEKLREGFSEHLEQTKGHVQRLERAFELLDEKPKSKTCKAMKGLVDEGAEAIGLDAPDSVRDADLIGAAQRVEHYEIAAYGTARAFAEQLGEGDVAELLQETLDEEAETDQKLTQLAETVNQEAETSAGAEK
jgi:ferritin-like metal-binding protein YciE